MIFLHSLLPWCTVPLAQVPLGARVDAERHGERGLAEESGDTGALDEDGTGGEGDDSEVLEVTVKVSA